MNAEARRILDPLLREEGYIPGEDRRKLYNAALEKDPTGWEIYYHRGIDFFEIGKYEEAFMDLTSALSLSVSPAENGMGETEEGKGMLEGADPMGEETAAEIYLFRGLCCRYLHYNGPAVSEFLRALSCASQSKGILYLRAKIELGYMYYLLGRDEEASSIFDEVEAMEKEEQESPHEMDRLFGRANVYRACLHHARGDVEKAEVFIKNNPFF